MATEKVEKTASSAANEGAKSVAEAVKKVADAAVAAVAKTSTGPTYDFDVAVTPGGKFQIDGAGFGIGGTVIIGGHQAETHGWSAQRIEGKAPGGISGEVEVVVNIDDKTKQTAKVRVA